MPGKGKHPTKAQAGRDNRSGNVSRLVRVAPGAVMTGVDLDHHLYARVEAATEVGRTSHRVDPNRHMTRLGKPAQTAGTFSIDPQRVGNEDVHAAGGGEHLRLPHRRHRNADGPTAQLQLGDLRALVRLDVRAHFQAELGPGADGP